MTVDRKSLALLFRNALHRAFWAAPKLGTLFCLLCICSLSCAAGDGVIETLQAQMAALQEELSSVRAEQRAQKKRLEQCGCGSTAQDSAALHSDLDTFADEPLELDGTNGTIVNVDVGNTDWLKEVLFGGKPWLIYCDDKKSARREPMPPVFRESAIQLSGMATFGAIDCWERTASGKTLAHRFDFRTTPVVFAVANGDPPLVVDLAGVTKPWQLRRKVQSHLRPNVTRIDSPHTFKALCTSRRACLMVGFKSANMLADTLTVLQPVLEDHRGVRAVAVDTSVWKVKLDDKLAATKPKRKDGQKEQPSLLCVVRQAGSHSRAGAFLRLIGDSDLKSENLVDFLERCERGRSLVPIKDAPQVSFRAPERPKYKSPQTGAGASPASAKSAPSSSAKSAPSSSAKPSTKKPAPSGKGAAAKKKIGKKARPMPRYSPDNKKSSSKPKASARKQDHVGSRDVLEEEDPLFSAVEDDGGLEHGDAASDDEGEEEVEL